MPQCKHLDARCPNSVVQEISDAAEVNPENALQFQVGRARSDSRLLRDEIEPASKFLFESFASLWSVCQPPTCRLLYLPVGARCDLNWQHPGFYGRRLRTSSASSNSPRSASAMASRRAASSSWLSVNVRSSVTKTVTT